MKSLIFSFVLFVHVTLLYAQEDITRTKVIMGTYVSLTLPQQNSELFLKAFALLKEIDNSLSTYKPTSPIYQLNTKRETKLSPYTQEALALALRYYTETQGYFNIAIGNRVRQLFTPQKKHPDDTDITHLRIDGQRAYLDGAIKLDLGGMGKGYGVDKLKFFLLDAGVKRAKIALSGDIYCIGICKIEVNNPLEKEPLASFSMKNSGVSTSGSYENYHKRPQNNHLLNPKTNLSQNSYISVTLISNKLSNADLDAYATAFSVMPPDVGRDFLNTKPLAYIVLTQDKGLHVSKNITKFVQDLKLLDTSKN